jgi:AcrR family transcriptional regulator
MIEDRNPASAPAHSIAVNDTPFEQPGSPEWWLSRSAEPDPASRGPGRPPVGLQRIIDAAIEILDDEGADALSMRGLAARLGSSTATLYRHVDSKDEILAHITDRILGETRPDGATYPTWQQACRAGACAFYTTLTKHPNAIPLLAKLVPAGPNALDVRERGIAVLLAAGFPPGLAARGYTAVAHFVIGFASQQPVDETADPERAGRLRAYYRSLDSRSFPATTAVAEVLPGATIDEEFQFGLNLIIDGLENALRTRAPLGARAGPSEG